MNELYFILGAIFGFGGVILGGILLFKTDNGIIYFLISAIIGATIMLCFMALDVADGNMQKEIYDKTVFQPWVKSLDSKSCEELGDVILKQKLLENKTAINAGLKIFNERQCHFDISSGQVLEMLK